jgi:AcrR family transcriptional regulator
MLEAMRQAGEQLGRREANKQATRRALQRSGRRLFAERGYQATTVRDIADAAGVTERTFFRYFAGKEGLVVDQLLSWLPVLQERISERPGEEDPLTAVRRALLELGSALDTNSEPAPLWLFNDGPLVGHIPRSAPAVLLKIEGALAEAIRGRLEGAGADPRDAEYLGDAFARTSLALIRSAIIRNWQLQTRDHAERPSLPELVDQAFDAVRSGAAD